MSGSRDEHGSGSDRGPSGRSPPLSNPVTVRLVPFGVVVVRTKRTPTDQVWVTVAQTTFGSESRDRGRRPLFLLSPYISFSEIPLVRSVLN